MKLLDANVLIAAASQNHPHHPVARSFIQTARSRGVRLCLTTITAMAFLRIMTHAKLHAQPLNVTQAIQWLQALERSSNLSWLHPELGHLERLLKLAPRLGGNLINDAHLAALGLEHGATLVSFDRDFEQFRGLSLELLRG